MSSSEEYQMSSIASVHGMFDTGVTSYIERSPIATKFRLENPNLQPLTDDDSDLDILATRSEDPSTKTDVRSSQSEVSSDFRNLSLTSEGSASSAGVKKHGALRKSFAKFKSASNLSRRSFMMLGATEYSNLNRNSEQVQPRQQSPFWKYHVLKFGNNLYLTTNPGLKHVYCRNGPGYYVEVVYNNPSTKHSKLRGGYRLIFEDTESIQSIKRENRTPIMIIEKKAEELGGHFTVSSLRESELIDGHIGYTAKKPPIFDRVLLPEIIDEKFTPFVRDMKLDIKVFKSYDFKDMNNIKWNIGPILRVRKSKMKKIKSKIVNGMTERVPEEGMVPEQHCKLINKKYVYFHRNYVNPDEHQHSNDGLYKEATGEPKNIYTHDTDMSFPPVLAVFRPCEMNKSKRVSMSMSKNISQFTGRQFEESRINKYSLEHDIGTGGDIKNYYTGGDGLYAQSHPVDDAPDDNKLGWISIYEDARIFSGRKQIGMFDIVIGTTLAVGLESYLKL